MKATARTAIPSKCFTSISGTVSGFGKKTSHGGYLARLVDLILLYTPYHPPRDGTRDELSDIRLRGSDGDAEFKEKKFRPVYIRGEYIVHVPTSRYDAEEDTEGEGREDDA